MRIILPQNDFTCIQNTKWLSKRNYIKRLEKIIDYVPISCFFFFSNYLSYSYLHSFALLLTRFTNNFIKIENSVVFFLQKFTFHTLKSVTVLSNSNYN